MQGLISLLFLIGLLVLWGAQQKKRFEKEQKYKKTKHKKLFLDKIEFPKVNFEETQDLKNRHLKSSIKTSTIIDVKQKKRAVEKIDRLSNLKKAVIWSEILSKPVSERELR